MKHVVAVAIAIGATAWIAGDRLSSQEPQRPAAPAARSWEPGPSLVPLEQSWIRWPLAASEQAYGSIDGRRLRGYVDELAAISRRSRDRGEQWWGRIPGM